MIRKETEVTDDKANRIHEPAKTGLSEVRHSRHPSGKGLLEVVHGTVLD